MEREPVTYGDAGRKDAGGAQIVIHQTVTPLESDRNMRHLVVLATLMTIPFAAAASQSDGPQNVLSLQPLTVVLRSIDVTAYSGEYERAITEKFSLGVGGTYWDGSLADDSAKYTSADFKVRYYLWTSALRGLSVGGSVGFSRVKTFTTTFGEQTFGGPSIGALAEYQLMLGGFAVALVAA